MKIAVVYTSRCKETKILADDLARYAKTYAREIKSFDFNESYDLLVIGFEEYYGLKDHELEEFLSQLRRDKIKNVALFNMFYFSNKQMERIIHLCYKYNLPLMRETYSAKKHFKAKPYLSDDIISSIRVYIEDMVNICQKYY